MQPYEREPMRHVRVSDDLWNQALTAVEARGDPSLSAVIRAALVAYVRETPTALRGGRRRGRHERPAAPPTPRRAT